MTTRRQRGAKVTQRGSSGKEFQIVEQEEDVPLPSAVELEKLNSFRPDLVDVVIDLVKKENNFRYSRLLRIDSYTFAERMVALLIVLLICVIAFGCAYFLAMSNHETTASVVGGGTLVMIISAILKRK